MEETSSVPEIVIPEYDKNKQTIMIIDDDSAMLWFVTEIFIDKYNVIPINNSTEVMSCLEQSSPDIIISDIMKPDIDGISLTTLIKGDKLQQTYTNDSFICQEYGGGSGKGYWIPEQRFI